MELNFYLLARSLLCIACGFRCKSGFTVFILFARLIELVFLFACLFVLLFIESLSLQSLLEIGNSSWYPSLFMLECSFIPRREYVCCLISSYFTTDSFFNLIFFDGCGYLNINTGVRGEKRYILISCHY